MATINWNNGKPSFDYANNAALGVNLSRQVNAPLDVSSEFSSVKDMLYYVTEGRYPTDGTGVSQKVKDMTKYPYLGQIIGLVNTETEEVSIYYIKTAEYNATLDTDEAVFEHYFEAVGKATIGDNKSIYLNEETGVLSLQDYGVQYYAFDDETKTWASSPTSGWKEGLTPKVIADGESTKIAWFEQSTITVEGLSTLVSQNSKEIEYLDAYGDKDIIPTDESYFTVSGETITGLTNDGNKQAMLVIPYKINDVKITSIANHAFLSDSVCTSIKIPNSITSIGQGAFSGFKLLTSINIPNSVISIESTTFAGCSSLTSITIPNSVTRIGVNAFSGCSALTSITIPNSVTSIGSYAFHIYDSTSRTYIPISGLTIYCEQGSYADTYANTNNIPVMYTDISATDFNNKADKATTLEGYGITDAYTKTETDSAISTAVSSLGSVFELKGYKTEEEFANLNASDYEAGDVFVVSISTGAGENINKEYVVVNKDGAKSFEVLGDPSGVTALTDRVVSLEGTVGNADSGLVADNNTNKTDIATLKTTVGDSTSGLVADNNTNKSDISALKTTVGDADSGLVKDNNTNKSDISAIKTDIGTAYDSAETSSIKGHIQKNTESIAANTEKLAGIEEGAEVNTIEGIKYKTKGSTYTTAEFSTDEGDNKILKIDVSSVAKADEASKVTNKATIFGKEYDGSAVVTIESKDIGVAKADQFGVVKSGSVDNIGEVVVDQLTGIGSVSKVANATNADEASKVTNKLKFGTKEYDGSAEAEVTLTDLGFKSSDYATAEQGTKADSAVQSVKVGDTTFTKDSSGNASITQADLQIALGLGSAAYEQATTFAKQTDLNTANTNIEALQNNTVKTSGDQEIAGTKTFTGSIVVPTPASNTNATNKEYVDTAISDAIKANDAMTFKGLLGGEGNPSALPTDVATVKNGDTYKVAVAGTYAEQEAEIGDMFIALVKESTLSWVYIPSANDVVSNGNLDDGKIIIGGGNQTISALSNGTNGQVLKIVDNTPAWTDERVASIANVDGDTSITIEQTNDTYKVAVNSVNVNKLEQTTGDVLVFDCGTSVI